MGFLKKMSGRQKLIPISSMLLILTFYLINTFNAFVFMFLHNCSWPESAWIVRGAAIILIGNVCLACYRLRGTTFGAGSLYDIQTLSQADRSEPQMSARRAKEVSITPRMQLKEAASLLERFLVNNHIYLSKQIWDI